MASEPVHPGQISEQSVSNGLQRHADRASRSRSKPVREMSEYTKELYYPCMTALTAKHPSSVQVAVAAAVTLTKYEALKSGTANVGVYLGTQSTVGTVAAGKRLILLEANLLTNIANSPRIAGVMVNGRWPSKADIDARLRAGQ
jgi:hypothetical protein